MVVRRVYRTLTSCPAVLLLAAPAVAHEVPGPARLGWGDWSFHPVVVAGLVAAAAAYVWLLRRFPARGRQPLYFWAGLGTVALALVSPLDRGAAYLFTLHMTQHMLLSMVAAPLLALGTPAALLGWVSKRPVAGRLMAWLFSPGVAVALYAGAFALWHLPAAYDAALSVEWVHAAQHVLFVVTGVIFWGVIAAPQPHLVNASFGKRIALLLIAAVANWVVSLVLALAQRPLYHPYEDAPRLWGLAPLADQQFGAALMWVMSNVLYVGAILAILVVLLRREERRPVAEG